MTLAALTGNDTMTFYVGANSRTLNDYADGDVITLEYSDDIMGMKEGKYGNTLYALNQTGKILYLATMVIFTVTIMIVLYYSKLNNILAFCIGLAVVTLSEQIVNLFLILGNNFNQIVIKLLKTFFNLDLAKTINKDINKSDAEIIQNQK